MTVRLITNEKIAETSSKGNQEKWKDGNKWYKLDQFGYEALAEVFTSRVLELSNIEQETPFSFLRYTMEMINVHGQNRVACVSDNFIEKQQSIITVNTLLKKHLGTPVSYVLDKLSSDKKRIHYLADAVCDCTMLSDFDKYLAMMFEIDSLILNDDRHLNNIAVLEENGQYQYCPIFDNGAGLLSNIITMRTDIDPKGLICSLRASPFGMSFNRMLKTTRGLFGSVFKLPVFSRKQITEMLYDLLTYYPERDRSTIADRVTECILIRQKFL